MSIRFEYKTSDKAEELIKKIQRDWARPILERYGKKGVELLKAATPVDTGKTAESWSYSISETPKGYAVSWHNSNRSGEGKGAVPIVVIIRYGHTTRNGGYVAPNDFVSPIVKDLFTQMAHDMWLEVTRV